MASPSAKVLVIGSTGNIGAEVVKQLRAASFTVLEAGRSAAVKLDIYDVESIRSLDEQLPGGVDHVVVCCGASTFGPLAGFDSTSWTNNCTNKLIGVTRLVVMLANGTEVRCLKEGGSITVTAGQAARTINKMWPGIATNNAGLEAFVRNAGLELPRAIRCNAVSPALVRETAIKAGLPLANTVGAAECAAEYVTLIRSEDTATVVDAGSQVAFTKSHHAAQKDGIMPPPPATGATDDQAADAASGGGSARLNGQDFRGNASVIARSSDEGVVGCAAMRACVCAECAECAECASVARASNVVAHCQCSTPSKHVACTIVTVQYPD